MWFDVKEMTCDKCPGLIEQAIRAIDPDATVAVDRTESRVQVEGAATEQQVVAALSAIGYQVSRPAPHTGVGSECCGGCS